MQNQSRDNFTGNTIGQFEILEEIGRGGMATVYRARQTNISRVVAIKVLPRALLHDPSFYERFTREVDVIARLEHPHILPIYDFGEFEGTPYIAMRYLGGGSMSQMVRRGLPPVNAVVKPFGQVAQALDYAHQQGIIHRDLKPANILLDENGNAYLSDFGIARVMNSNLTGSAIIGTPAYMSPEQAHGLPLDGRSDIYSLGVVLFELLTGREPYEAETPVALLLKHINEPMPSVRMFRPEVSPEVEEIVFVATAKNPNDRFPSAGDMAQALQEALPKTSTRTRVPVISADMPTLVQDTPPPITSPRMADQPTITPPPMNPPPLTSPGYVPQVPPPSAQPQAAQKSSQRTMPMIMGGAALIALLVIGGIVFAISSQPAPPVLVTPTVDTAAVSALPTPAANSVSWERDLFSINVPEGWSEADLSGENFIAQAWHHDEDAYITLSIFDESAPAGDLSAQIEQYQSEHFPPETAAFIDEAAAPDGTVRRSYRRFGEMSPNFEDGQTDAFYWQHGPWFVVLETFSGDSAGNDYVGMFQQVLDSVRINSDASETS